MGRGQSKTRPPKAKQQSSANSTQTLYPPPPLSTSPSSVPQPTTLSYSQTPKSLSFGLSSCATASSVVESLMDRLQITHDFAVAFKCLLAVHHVIKYGSFILQD
ncbi:hypothetical protein GBA52_026104 [Prunus armeniaca]|nr:hypothetical protein GBA52_026104 [Prunus armeniaca]